MATYCVSGSQYNSAGPRQWKCKIRGRHHSDDIRMVRIRTPHYRYDRVVGHDIEHQSVGQIDGRLTRSIGEKLLGRKKFMTMKNVDGAMDGISINGPHSGISASITRPGQNFIPFSSWPSGLVCTCISCRLDIEHLQGFWISGLDLSISWRVDMRVMSRGNCPHIVLQTQSV